MDQYPIYVYPSFTLNGAGRCRVENDEDLLAAVALICAAAMEIENA